MPKTKQIRWTERRLERRLLAMFENAAPVSDVRTIEDAGVLTMNRGLVVTFADGTEFQFQVLLSRRGRRDSAVS